NGIVEQYNDLPGSLQAVVLGNVKSLHPALRESSRSSKQKVALAAIRLIAAGKQGKLTYILAEGLHGTDDVLAKTACDAIVELARWTANSTRKLQLGTGSNPNEKPSEDAAGDPLELYEQIISQRPEIEYAV